MNQLKHFKTFSLRAAMLLLMMVLTATTAWADQTLGDWTFYKSSDGTLCYISGYSGPTGITKLTIPSKLDGASVVGINGINFSNFTNLETLSFDIPCAISEMPSMRNCSKLKNIKTIQRNNTLPKSITKIPNNCFMGTAIDTLTMPSVTQVGSEAFKGCSSLTVVVFKQAATIGNSAFREIPSSCRITYPGPMSNWNVGKYMYSPNLIVYGTTDDSKNWFCGWCGGANYDSGNYLYYTMDTEGNMTVRPYWDTYDQSKQVIATHRWRDTSNGTLYHEKIKTLTLEHVYAIGDNSFKECSNLTTISFGNNVTSIGNYAFNYCSSLTSVAIPASVTSIGNDAFLSCIGLTSVTIPASVTSIGDFTFANCTGLTSVTVYATAVPTLGLSVFGKNADGRKIYVFSDRERAYELATNWNAYASAIEPITLGVTDAGGTLGSWTTYYNGLADVTVSEGTTIYKAALSDDKKSVTLTQVSGDIVKRGEAVLLKSTTDIKLSSAASSGDGDYTDNALHGVDYATATSTLGEGTFYVLGKEGDHFGFHKFTDATMPAQKAYLLLSGDTPSSLNLTLGNSGTTQLVCRWTPQDGGTVTANGTEVTATPADGYYVNRVVWYETDPDGGAVGSSAELNSDGMGHYIAPQPYGYIVVTFHKYSDYNGVRVSFNMKGHGTAPAAQDLHLGETVTQPDDPTAKDYVFLGWYTNSSCTKPYDFDTVLDNTLYFDTSNDRYTLTLYAKWAKLGGSCGKSGSDLYWYVSKSAGSSTNDVLTIFGSGEMKEYEEDEHPWIIYINQIKTIVIEEGVTTISKDAFYDFVNVTSDITIPASVTSIGNHAFADVSRNTTAGIHITAAEGSLLASLGGSAFDIANASIDLSPCTHLTAISNGLQFIVNHDVTLPSSVTSICQWAFSRYSDLHFSGDHVYVVVPDGKALSVTIDGVTEPVVIEPTDGKADIIGCLYADPANRAASRALTLALVADQTTSLSEELRVKSEESATAAEWYDLSGRKLDGKPSLRGIYINNGKKVAIK